VAEALKAAGLTEKNYLNNANPLHLNNLFESYPQISFNLFHTGYPFGREAGVLAKCFQMYMWIFHGHIFSERPDRAQYLTGGNPVWKGITIPPVASLGSAAVMTWTKRRQSGSRAIWRISTEIVRTSGLT